MPSIVPQVLLFTTGCFATGVLFAWLYFERRNRLERAALKRYLTAKVRERFEVYVEIQARVQALIEDFDHSQRELSERLSQHGRRVGELQNALASGETRDEARADAPVWTSEASRAADPDTCGTPEQVEAWQQHLCFLQAESEAEIERQSSRLRDLTDRVRALAPTGDRAASNGSGSDAWQERYDDLRTASAAEVADLEQRLWDTERELSQAKERGQARAQEVDESLAPLEAENDALSTARLEAVHELVERDDALGMLEDQVARLSEEGYRREEYLAQLELEVQALRDAGARAPLAVDPAEQESPIESGGPSGGPPAGRSSDEPRHEPRGEAPAEAAAEAGAESETLREARAELAVLRDRFESTLGAIEAEDEAAELEWLESEREREAIAEATVGLEDELSELAQVLESLGGELEALRAGHLPATEATPASGRQVHGAAELEQELETLALQLETFAAEHDDLRSRHVTLLERAGALAAHPDAATEAEPGSNSASVGAQALEAQRELEALAGELEVFAAGHEELRADHRALQERHEALRARQSAGDGADRAALAGQAEAAREELEALAAELETFAAEHEALRAEHRALEQRHETLLAQRGAGGNADPGALVGEAAEELDALASVLEVFALEHESLRAEQRAASEERERKDASFEQLSRTLAERGGELDTLRADHALLSAELAGLRADADGRSSQIAELMGAFEQAQATLGDAADEPEGAESSFQVAQGVLEKLKPVLDALEGELERGVRSGSAASPDGSEGRE